MSKECDPVKFYPPSDVFGGKKPVPCCLPEPVRPLDELRRPTAVTPDPEAIKRPRGIIVRNLEVSADCAQGSYGSTVTIAAGTLQETVQFSSVNTISDSVLNYIATTKPDVVSRIEEDLANSTLSPAAIAAYTGMSVADATLLYDVLMATLSSLNTSALSLANAQLVCVWKNTAQTAQCDDPEMATNAEHPAAVFTYTVDAGTVESALSQADADARALQLATSNLNCFYISDPFEADCRTRPDRPNEDMEEVATDGTEIYPGLPRRVGKYFVTGAAFTSTLSKADANEQAQNFAFSKLVCFYINPRIYIQCDDPNARGIGLDPETTEPVQADLATATSGQSVLIEPGYIVSELSTEDAEAQANTLAESLLECCFINRELHVECPDHPVVDQRGNPVLDPYGNQLMIPASQTDSPVWSIDIPAGQFTSCESQAVADSLAQEAVAGVLDCYYCNTVVLPTCVPEWLTIALTDGLELPDGTIYRQTLPINFLELTDPYTGQPVDLSEWSMDATVGMNENAFCSPEYEQSQQIAESAGQSKIERVSDGRTECQFANDLIIAACSASDPYDAGNEANQHSGTTPTGEAYIFYSKYGAGACLDSKLSTPAPGEYVEIPAETIIMTAAETPGTTPVWSDTDPPEELVPYSQETNDKLVKAYANKLAFQMAQSLLTCYFSNPDTEGICELSQSVPEFDEPLCMDEWKIAGRKSGLGLSPTSNTGLNPLKVPAGMFISAGSLKDVYDMTVQFVQANLVCEYCNEEQTAECGPNLTQVSLAVVPPCTYVSATLAEANEAAKALAESMVACVDPGTVGPPGPKGDKGDPGPPGQYSGGGCSGNCFGIYS